MNMGFEEQAYNEGQDDKYEEKIIELSHEFAALVPADTFSPAEVQGLLLEHKRFPERAVAHAAEWVTKRTLKMRKEQLSCDNISSLSSCINRKQFPGWQSYIYQICNYDPWLEKYPYESIVRGLQSLLREYSKYPVNPGHQQHKTCVT
jgi:hypothetical protein